MLPTTLRHGLKATTAFTFSRFKTNFILMRNRSYLANLKSYAGPTRKEKDTIGEIEVPSTCLWGAQTQRYMKEMMMMMEYPY